MKFLPNYLNIRRTAALLVLVVLVAASMGGGIFAFARGYSTDDDSLKPGMVVALNKDSDRGNPKVERASTENAERAVGVAISDADSSVTISSGTKQVLVETNGEADTYVSDINGAIKQGDLLEVSPLKGILMKADKVDGVIIGIALEDARLDEDDSYSVQIDGDKKTALIARIRVSLDQKAISSAPQKADSSLERLGKSIVGKDVSEIRMIIALLIFIMVLIAEGGIIYGAVSSAITSLGRNPMARNVIRSEVTRVMLVALAVLLIGLGAVYMILWV